MAARLHSRVNAFREGRYQEAFELLGTLLQEERARNQGIDLPEGVLWYHGLAAAHLGRYDQAIEDFAVLTGRAVADERADPLATIPLKTNDYRYALATMLYLAGRHDQAAPTFRRALEFDLGLFPAHVQLARMLEAEERWEEAIVQRQAAVAANPGDATLLTQLGTTQLRAGRLKEASETFELARVTNRRDPAPPYLAGLVALRLDRRDAAREAFTDFLHLAPSRYAAQIAEAREHLAQLEGTP